MDWSEQQENFFAAAADRDRGNLVVRARAGSGKTTTAVEGVHRAPPGGKLMTAFNKKNVVELQRRLPQDVTVQTLHSLGLATLRRHLRVHIDTDKGMRIAREVAKTVPRPPPSPFYEADRAERELPWTLMRLVSLFKGAQPADMNEAVRMVYDFDAYNVVYSAQQMAQLAAECLRRAAADPRVVDFADMIYLPRRLNLAPAPYGLVVIDETQDMNRGQLSLVLEAGSRVIAVGDEAQAIYRWRGADEHAMARIIEGLDAEVLPLSVTYRCPQAVVDFVKNELGDLDDFQAAEGAPAGRVEYTEDLRPELGDYVLSRFNAPLVQEALAVARTGRKVQIQGTDLSGQLNGMIGASKARTPKDLLKWSREAFQAERNELLEADMPHQVSRLRDKHSVLGVLARECSTLGNVKAAARRLFATSNAEPHSVVTFSTVHRAKGDERHRVWMLGSTFDPTMNTEERNIFYVAATRAREELYIVEDPYDEILEGWIA